MIRFDDDSMMIHDDDDDDLLFIVLLIHYWQWGLCNNDYDSDPESSISQADTL